ncbi:MAG: T9SS type A sorting domain-containing protein, partial [Bacteroidetes bacterium]|nr:T9SS type A sorting domain-containing protein [Bacteroidota bacterium]
SLDLNGPVSTEGVREAVSSTASAYPNPFVEWVAFEFEGLDFGSHSLQIFDTSGRLVRSIAFQANSESASTARWDGTDEQGMAVASGMYFARVGARDRIAGPTLQVIRIR